MQAKAGPSLWQSFFWTMIHLDATDCKPRYLMRTALLESRGLPTKPADALNEHPAVPLEGSFQLEADVALRRFTSGAYR